MVVVGDVGEVMTVAEGLDAAAVQVPVPVAAIVTMPVLVHTVWSGPALGSAVTITLAVSLQLFEVRI